MIEYEKLESLIKEIEVKKEKLDNLVLLEDHNESLLKLSMEIDNLINHYYHAITLDN